MNVRKRGLALLMCICMIFTLLPFSALADATAKVLYVDAKSGSDDNNGTEANPYKTVGKALEQTVKDDTYTIHLGAGEYSVYGSTTLEGKNLTLTFVGSGRDKTTWNIGTGDTDAHSQSNADFGFKDNNSLTFKNMTLKAGVQKNGTQVAWDYVGFAHTNYTKVDNCDINGKTFYWGYKSAEFNNCTFNCPTGDYAIWTYCSPTMSFNNCTFNSSGKVINVYNENGNADYKINFNNLTVNNKGIPLKQVLNINDSRVKGFTISITGNTVLTGFDADSIVDKNTCSRLFGFGGKASTNNKAKTVVNFGETTVWKDGGMVDAAAYHKDGVTVSDVSYNNGNAAANDSLYTDGYKDNAVSKNTEWVGNKLYATYKCEYCGWTDKEVVQQKWDIPVSKTATELKKDAKGDYKTGVTLSVPAVEEALVSEIVFVLDGSSSADTEVVKQSLSLLNDLKKAASDNGATVNVCVVKFKRQAFKSAWFDLATQFDDINEAMETKYSGGTNIHAGLLAGKAALEEHNNVAANRKYLVLISDGSTYLYSKDGDWASDMPFTRSYYTKENYQGFAGSFNDQGWYEPNNYPEVNVPRPKTTSDVDAWQAYFADVKARNETVNTEGKTGDDYDYHCEYDKNFNEGIPSADFKSQPCEPRTANNRDMAYYYADQTWQQIKAAGYNAYSIAVADGSAGAGNSDDSHCFMNYLNEGKSLDFNDIKKDILYAVDKGSYVVDVIGDKFELFDLEPDHNGFSSLKLYVGDKELTNRFILANVENGDFTVYYFDDGFETNTLLDNNDSLNKELLEHYRFMVAYDAASKTLTWTFNEEVSNFAPVQLSYTLKLTKPETKPGTYGKLDLDGSNYDKDAKYPNVLYTNEYAKLYPKCSNGIDGTPTDFPMPSVEYTVKNPYRPPVNPGIGDEIIVEITGNSDSVVYDGTEHSVKDYTVKISDPRYTEADFTFTGKAEASGVNAGTYEMGLKAEQFKNTNARFTNVKFVIKADGVLTITPKDLTITAGSKTEYGPTPVTCDEWTVSGLAAGDKVESVKITGIQSVPGSSPNVPSDAVIKNAKGEDVTKNYAIKYVNGTLTMLEVLNKEDHFNYIIGTPEGLSLPTANVTRAEVATIFFRLMTDDARAKFDSLDNNFSDVAKGQWYNRAISTLANAGIIKGDPAGTYRPGDPITRAEMATIIARFGDFKEGGKTFNDISGHWAQKYIELAASNGWINGNPDGTFKPNNNITRAETVAMINRVLDRQTKDVSDLLPVSQMTNWSDNANTAAWYYRDIQEATNNHKAERVGNSIYEKWTEKLPDIDWASYQI